MILTLKPMLIIWDTSYKWGLITMTTLPCSPPPSPPTMSLTSCPPMHHFSVSWVQGGQFSSLWHGWLTETHRSHDRSHDKQYRHVLSRGTNRWAHQFAKSKKSCVYQTLTVNPINRLIGVFKIKDDG